MPDTTEQEEFADYLRLLKNRTGRSYDALAARLGISSSTLHRYCSGRQVPPEYAVAERIARECGADRQELARLRHMWVRATETPGSARDAEPGPARESSAVEASSTGEEPPSAYATGPGAPAPPGPSASRRPIVVIGVVVLLICGLGAWWAVGGPGASSAPSPPGSSSTRPVRAATARSSPAATTATIQDTAIGTGVGTVQYTGRSWTRCGDGGGCVTTPDHSYYFGYRVGQSFTVRFRGSQIKVYAPTDLAGGIARVTVDGRPAGTVDFRASAAINGLRWTSANLADGDHGVTFTIGDTDRQDNVVLFDRAEVTV
ncbi:helix-turn-helix domain-containing protein [Actinoallomurus sp. CA-150999]|uniref:helix-turn-helix domain-containing protein n=1 Tax=Actinoallomurus sp. CA-150999 TaxID=3239887 RepID=UPI003D8A7C1C